MYHINQFKPTLYVLLVLGITGFALASESPGIWVLGIGGVVLNAWLVKTKRFRPLPRLVANLVTLASMLFVASQLAGLNSSAVLIIGQFLVVLQLVKLWEQRLNRDYAQLLVLSLLLMVAASISTGSLLFGVLLAAYLFVSLYCCLLFHLKVETDKAKAMFARQANPVAAGGPGRPHHPAADPAPLRQDQRHLGRSMRRLSAVVSVGSVGTAVVVFLAFPRGPAQGMFVPPQLRVGNPMTGFSDSVNFDQVARIQQNDKIVAYADVRKNGRKLGPGDTIYLRGVALDRYSSPALDPGWDPTRYRGRGTGFRRDQRGEPVKFATVEETANELPGSDLASKAVGALRDLGNRLGGAATRPALDTYVQTIDLQPTQTKVLFVVSGTAAEGQLVATARSINNASRDVQVYQGADRALQTEDALSGPIRYEVTASDAPEAELRLPSGRTSPYELPDVVDPKTGAEVKGVRIAGRVASPSYVRSFGVWDRDVIVEVDGQPLADVPADDRIARVADAYVRRGRKVTVVRPGPGGLGRRVEFPYVPPAIEAYAHRPDVSGTDDAGRPLAEQRDRLAGPGPLDEQIAHNIAHHFQSQYAYTLDVTDARTRKDQDPILWFLSEDGRRGHCEYFAGAMALLCQDLGLTARVAVGFKCDNYNTFKEQFEVTQAHAHSWVEVLTPEGWRTFDP
ncbi:MAG: hypothetical protein JWO31_1868, partial [Phycisphaerales bacterium]|nr:hypothetical protein [Phycisphaerales bacterium]